MTSTIRCVRDHTLVWPSSPDDRTVLCCTEPPPHFSGPSVGRGIGRTLARLGGQASTGARDLVAIAMGVTAADTFVHRADAADGWCRMIHLVVPVEDPNACSGVVDILREALGFLSGDMWSLEFVQALPWDLPAVRRRPQLGQASCAILFSGGLDSAIGALDLLKAEKRPVLVRHAYPKDASRQTMVMKQLPPGHMQIAFNADPRCTGIQHDVSMRTRSFNFLAVGAAVADAISRTKNVASTDLLVPENGFIALNPPLTRRRLGSHSTRTTHPHFLARYQQILDRLGIRARIDNPYRSRTKGEMMQACKDEPRLRIVAPVTVSCGKWKRRNQQCGKCVPCLIRRAAFKCAGWTDMTDYEAPDLRAALDEMRYRDDVLAMGLAAGRPTSEMAAWARTSGPMPEDEAEFDDWVGIAGRGMKEVAALLRKERIIP
ncbi:Qat anti-phage system QueC-like protein QatC [Roseomonas sp. USHLN139]|uniref:Qat anti-phage system QueC-like protein QatC n=1 Tax=Roseomonas sp. USHLN139 TaxID=3081298 RepID=UPI003B0157B2